MYKQRSAANLFIGLLLLFPIIGWFFIEFYRWPLELLPEHFYFFQALDIMPTTGVLRIVKYLQCGGILLYAYMMIAIIPQRFSGAHHPVYWCFTALTLIALRLWTLLAIPGMETLLSNTFGITLPADHGWLLTVIAYSVMLGPVCLLFLLFIPRPKLCSRIQSLGRYILAVFLGVTGGLFLQLFLSLLQLYLPEEVAVIFTSYREQSIGKDNLIALLICAPLFEEIAFRGLIQGRLQNHWPLWLAVLLSSGFYAFWHGSFTLFCCMFVTGISYGFYYYYTQRLRYCVAAHAMTNYVCLLFHSSAHSPVFSDMLLLFSELSPYLKLFLILTCALVMLGIIRIAGNS